jgi:hypothetical protein
MPSFSASPPPPPPAFSLSKDKVPHSHCRNPWTLPRTGSGCSLKLLPTRKGPDSGSMVLPQLFPEPEVQHKQHAFDKQQPPGTNLSTSHVQPSAGRCQRVRGFDRSLGRVPDTLVGPPVSRSQFLGLDWYIVGGTLRRDQVKEQPHPSYSGGKGRGQRCFLQGHLSMLQTL